MPSLGDFLRTAKRTAVGSCPKGCGSVCEATGLSRCEWECLKFDGQLGNSPRRSTDCWVSGDGWCPNRYGTDNHCQTAGQDTAALFLRPSNADSAMQCGGPQCSQQDPVAEGLRGHDEAASQNTYELLLNLIGCLGAHLSHCPTSDWMSCRSVVHSAVCGNSAVTGESLTEPGMQE